MKSVEKLRALGIAELEERLAEATNELAKEKAGVAAGNRPEKPAKIRNLRREIAKINTLTKEKTAGVEKKK